MADAKMNQTKAQGEGWLWVNAVFLSSTDKKPLARFSASTRSRARPRPSRSTDPKKIEAARTKLAELQESEGHGAADLDKVRGVTVHEGQIREIRAELTTSPG